MVDNKIDFFKFRLPENIAQLKIPPVETPSITNMPQVDLSAFKRVSKVLEDQGKEKEIYKQRILSALEGIQRNTANLTEIMSILHDNNEKQDEIFEIIVELLSISKAKSEEEATSTFRKVADKISKFTGDVGTMQKLFGYANSVWSIYQGLS